MVNSYVLDQDHEFKEAYRSFSLQESCLHGYCVVELAQKMEAMPGWLWALLLPSPLPHRTLYEKNRFLTHQLHSLK